jgi:CheY-like chemotaxis protein
LTKAIWAKADEIAKPRIYPRGKSSSPFGYRLANDRNFQAATALTGMSETKVHAKPAILVVEDEELLRLNATDLLEDNGYTVIEAANAEDALRTLERRPDVRLLFTDIQMPGRIDGIELARLVHERWPHILLVMTSGQEQPSQTEIPDEGRFIAKPYRAGELLGQVNKMLTRSS